MSRTKLPYTVKLGWSCVLNQSYVFNGMCVNVHVHSQNYMILLNTNGAGVKYVCVPFQEVIILLNTS